MGFNSFTPTALPPTGPAGGGLAGNFPNPTVSPAPGLDTTALHAMPPVVLTQQAGNYAFVLADAQTRVQYSGVAAGTFTIPANATVAFPVGTVIEVSQTNTGQLAIAGAAGVTVHSDGAKVHTAGQYATIGLIKVATDEWWLTGDLV